MKETLLPKGKNYLAAISSWRVLPGRTMVLHTDRVCGGGCGRKSSKQCLR